MFSLRERQRELGQDKRYIHRITDTAGIQMVVTMLPHLAQKMHAVNASLHDNTYKRTWGKWNEWEVVIWDSQLNMRESERSFYLRFRIITFFHHTHCRAHCGAHILRP
ncbi:MAG TPA: hypothetical protein VGO47_08710 [Chlamydiales bacterium]|jgi:hypothetical protein|nr:hypothetical protein [Chlamydiales bacterium]